MASPIYLHKQMNPFVHLRSLSGNIAIPFSPYVFTGLRWKICSFSSPIHMDWEGLSLFKQCLDEKPRIFKECTTSLPSTTAATLASKQYLECSHRSHSPDSPHAKYIANAPSNPYRHIPDPSPPAASSQFAEPSIHLSLTTSTIWGWLTGAVLVS